MDVSTRMEVGQRGASMDNRLNRIRGRDLTVGGSLDQVEQGWAVQIFLNEKLATVMGSLPKDVDDVGEGRPPWIVVALSFVGQPSSTSERSASHGLNTEPRRRWLSRGGLPSALA